MRILLKYRILILLIDILEFDMKKNIKKKKIKVPAAQFGLGNSGYQLQAPTLNDYYQRYQTNLKLGDTAGMYEMKYGVDLNDERLYNLTLQGLQNTAGNIDKLNQLKAGTGNADKKLPGLSGVDVAGIAQALPGAINTLTSPFQTSTATTGKEATMQSLTGIAEGIGAGAQLGSAIGGPVGAAVGGAAGMVTGLIGKKGRKAGMTSFTDYDEGTLGTGLIGAFKNKKLRRHRAVVKNNAYLNRQAVIGTENLANQWNEENAGYDTNTFEYGGSTPTSLAYVDDGELISTPDGFVSKVSEQGQPTDSNLIDLPEGSRILSNTLKVPGTNKTFAELGDKMMVKRNSKGKDIFAQNADMLNRMNNQEMHNKLFAMQEELKAKKGIKPKSKSIEQFQGGGTSSRHNTIYVNGTRYNLGDTFAYNGTNYKVTGTNKAKPIKARDTWGIKGDISAPWLDTIEKEVNLPEVTVTADRIAKPTVTTNIPKKSVINTVTPLTTTKVNETIVTPNEPVQTVSIPEIPFVYDEDELNYKPDIESTYIPHYQTRKDVRREKLGDITNSLSGLVSGISSLAPIMSNLFTSDPEAVPANYNPYASAITNTMGRRRYNIDPLLRDIDTNRAVADYSASQQMTNTGHNMAFRLQNAIQTNKAKAAARAAESNANNQYRGEYANAMNDLGRQWVNATNLASDLNARNRAQTRNIRRTGLGQLSQWAQNRELMRNQKSRDEAMMKLYDPFLQAGFTAADLAEFRKYLRKGGNK